MDHSRAVTLPPDDHADLLPLLDEEIDRLPSRFRDVILLCDLDGLSRHDAAAQLRLPEGTVSSRLNRGRALLRDRLTRRGASIGTTALTAIVSETTQAALPDRLAVSTAHLAFTFSTGGTVPATVRSLAEGVIRMMSLTKLTLTASALLALTTTAGIVLAVVPDGEKKATDTPPPAVAAEVPKAIEKPAPPAQPIRGIVVDPDGQPVADALVRAAPFSGYETEAVTGADGSFTIAAPKGQGYGMLQSYSTKMLASPKHGDQVGAILYQVPRNKTIADTPARIVLQSAKPIVVKVVDANKVPVAGASIEIVSGNSPVASATTGDDGASRLLVTKRARVSLIVAMKPGLGFDFAEFGFIDEKGRSRGGVPADELPEAVTLTLDGGQTARIKAVDRAGKPLAGVRFAPWLLTKEGRRSWLDYQSGMLAATTGPDGIATFDWLPPWSRTLVFRPTTEGYAYRQVMVDVGETGVVTAKLSRNSTIRGRVVHADGSPAMEVMVRAYGTGRGFDFGHGFATTGDDGRYEMTVPADEGYAVAVESRDWAAPSHLDVVVREGQPVTGVDFTLSTGTILRGTVTVGPDNRPATSQSATLMELGGPPPNDLREPDGPFSHDIRRPLGIRIDPSGRYSIRVGPGTYTLMGPDQKTAIEMIVVKDEPELVHNFRLPGPVAP